MSSIPRKYGLKNDKFATRITSKDRSANATPRRTTSFYVLGFLLVVLVLSDRARLSERLWDTLVPERNWTPLTPQFWILLVATVSLYTYNRLHPKEDNVLPSEDKKRSEALLRLKSG
uniref:Uncharacterized protein n=1 Tax=Babesia bovis TaxID=5865 RepID=A7AMJ1_BABBO|eukprot:XP_001611343.1 hypothetical protein [Babesia bovis T2Bo]